MRFTIVREPVEVIGFYSSGTADLHAAQRKRHHACQNRGWANVSHLETIPTYVRSPTACSSKAAFLILSMCDYCQRTVG